MQLQRHKESTWLDIALDGFVKGFVILGCPRDVIVDLHVFQAVS